MLSDQWNDPCLLQWTVLVPAVTIAVMVCDGSHDVVVVSGDSIAWEGVLSCLPSVKVATVSAEGAVGTALLNYHDRCWVGCRDGCWVKYVENQKPAAVATTCQ